MQVMVVPYPSDHDLRTTTSNRFRFSIFSETIALELLESIGYIFYMYTMHGNLQTCDSMAVVKWSLRNKLEHIVNQIQTQINTLYKNTKNKQKNNECLK